VSASAADRRPTRPEARRAARRPGPVMVVALVGAAALVGLLAYGVFVNQPKRGIDAALAAGKRPAAPSLSLPRLGGTAPVSLSAWRGKVVVLNYWASWCPPCRDESPLLERWQKRIAPQGGTILGVDSLDVTSDARAFMRQYGLTYPMLHDGDGHSQQRFGITGYPESFVIDRRGRIAAVQRGTVDDAFMRNSVLPLLKERA
jgi:cytochrome c biogenesis protein CcmG, thiol:disulfide interchange protein DsbE